MAVTTNYGFTKPDVGGDDGTWGGTLNTDLDQIDAQIKNRENEIDALESIVNAQLRLTTYAGFGPVDTKIMQFVTSISDTSGSYFSHNHGSYGNDGLEITIDKAGVYAFTFTHQGGVNSFASAGLSLNSNQLTTSITAITQAHKLALVTCSVIAGQAEVKVIPAVGYFAVNDIVRPHTQGDVPNAAANCIFTAVYLGVTQ
jgi:hypothetical protein